jgi:hypothetical protein
MIHPKGTTMRLLSILAPLVAMVLLACGDDTGGAGGGGSAGTGTGGAAPEDLEAEVCEHYAEGPFIEHTAADAVESAPDVSTEHTAHRITLIELAGANGGYVTFQAPAAGEYVFFFDQDVPLSVQSSAGSDVLIEESCDPSACSATCDLVKGKHLVDLAVGTYYLELGPTDLASVHLAHEALGGEHED